MLSIHKFKGDRPQDYYTEAEKAKLKALEEQQATRQKSGASAEYLAAPLTLVDELNLRDRIKPETRDPEAEAAARAAEAKVREALNFKVELDPATGAPISINGKPLTTNFAHYEGMPPDTVVLPKWIGKMAQHLGLQNPQSAADLPTMFAQMEEAGEGYAPGTDKTQSVKINASKKHMVGYDFEWSCHKSVSLQAELGTEAERIAFRDAFSASIEVAMAFVESETRVRRGAAGADDKSEKVAGILAASFQHDASRELDPQLHAHSIFYNIALCENGDYRTWDAKPLMQLKKAAGALFRAEMASRITQMGYSIERCGKDGSDFRLKGYPEESVKQASKRAQQIKEYSEKHGNTTAEGKQFAALATRKAKHEPSRPELLRYWQEIEGNYGVTPALSLELLTLRERELAALDKAVRDAEPGTPEALAAAQAAAAARKPFELDVPALLKKVISMQSCFAEKDVLEAIAIQAVGHWDIKRIREEAQNVIENSSLMALEIDEYGRRLFTTKERYAVEKLFLDLVDQGKNDRRHALPEAEVLAGIAEFEKRKTGPRGKFELKNEQREALLHICSRTGRIAAIQGKPGTGKTTLLECAREILEKAGFECFGAAIAGKAAKGLQDESGIGSSTVEQFLIDISSEKIKLHDKAFLFIDEAGMVGSEQMTELAVLCEKAGAKFMLVGDTEQLPPVAAGAPMASMVKHFSEDGVIYTMSQITRQKEEWMRTVVHRMQAAHHHAFELDARGRPIERNEKGEILPHRDARSVVGAGEGAAAEKRIRTPIYEVRPQLPAVLGDESGLSQKHATNGRAAIDALYEHGRLRFHGEQSHTELAMVDAYLNATIERVDSEGNVRVEKVKDEEKLMIAGTREETFRLNQLTRELLKQRRNERGEPVLGAKEYPAPYDSGGDGEHYRNLAVGERVIFKAPHKQPRVENGTVGRITALGFEGQDLIAHILLDPIEGKPLREVRVNLTEYRKIEYGHCVTAHASQGATKDWSCTLLSPGMDTREWTGVAMSRARGIALAMVTERELPERAILDAKIWHQLSKEEQKAYVLEQQKQILTKEITRSSAKFSAIDRPAPEGERAEGTVPLMEPYEPPSHKAVRLAEEARAAAAAAASNPSSQASKLAPQSAPSPAGVATPVAESAAGEAGAAGKGDGSKAPQFAPATNPASTAATPAAGAIAPAPTAAPIPTGKAAPTATPAVAPSPVRATPLVSLGFQVPGRPMALDIAIQVPEIGSLRAAVAAKLAGETPAIGAAPDVAKSAAIVAPVLGDLKAEVEKVRQANEQQRKAKADAERAAALEADKRAAQERAAAAAASPSTAQPSPTQSPAKAPTTETPRAPSPWRSRF